MGPLFPVLNHITLFHMLQNRNLLKFCIFSTGAAINTDDENEEEEYEAWKVRELKRIKNVREAREAREKEVKYAIDRIGNAVMNASHTHNEISCDLSYMQHLTRS